MTSHNTVCPKEKDYGGSHTEEEPDHEDNRQNFYRLDKDNVSPIISHTFSTSSNTACITPPEKLLNTIPRVIPEEDPTDNLSMTRVTRQSVKPSDFALRRTTTMRTAAVAVSV